MTDNVAEGDVPLLDVRDLSLEYRTGGAWTRVVDDVNFAVRAGQTVALVGESGSGKTVSATAVMGLVNRRNGRISSGSIRFQGRELVDLPEKEARRIRGAEIAMIFQNPMRSLNPAYTVGDQVAEAARVHLGMDRKQAQKRAIEMFDTVGIANATQRIDDYPHMFSGGMAQRIAIAVALCGEPSLIIADEPTTALDVTVQARILTLFREIQESTGVSVLFISHDLGVVAEVADSVVVMYAGEVVESGDSEGVFVHPQHPYTSGLLASVPVLGSGQRLVSIPGTIPGPDDRQGECRFLPRCSHADLDVCVGPPPLVTTPHGGTARCFRSAELDLRGVLGS